MAADVLTRLLSPFGGLVRVVMCRLRAQGIGGGGPFGLSSPLHPTPRRPGNTITWKSDLVNATAIIFAPFGTNPFCRIKEC